MFKIKWWNNNHTHAQHNQLGEKIVYSINLPSRVFAMVADLPMKKVCNLRVLSKMDTSLHAINHNHTIMLFQGFLTVALLVRYWTVTVTGLLVGI